MNRFIFYDIQNIICDELKARIVEIRTKINNKNDLFVNFKLELNLPSYFGENWDALFDCLCDLDWIEKYYVDIIHKDIPFINSKFDQIKYIELLLDVMSNWKKSPIHNVRIYFPKHFQSDIENIIKNL